MVWILPAHYDLAGLSGSQYDRQQTDSQGPVPAMHRHLSSKIEKLRLIRSAPAIQQGPTIASPVDVSLSKRGLARRLMCSAEQTPHVFAAADPARELTNPSTSSGGANNPASSARSGPRFSFAARSPESAFRVLPHATGRARPRGARPVRAMPPLALLVHRGA